MQAVITTEGALDKMSEEKKAEKFSFGAVLNRREQTVYFPGMDEKYFISATSPDYRGLKRIEAAGIEFVDGGIEIDEDGKAYTPNVSFRTRAEDVFMAKCLAQITDFCIAETDEDGNVIGELTYSRKQRGDNKENKVIYNALTGQAGDYIEGALDYIAGRTTVQREEYEALKNASKSSAIIS